mmetsp:Transcript_161798/g.519027  ORF Transcript_161798/g.519027 Transcript_161798/m.519027 type:complete len:295 (-) Transcript_161798:935-1819(-)
MHIVGQLAQHRRQATKVFAQRGNLPRHAFQVGITLLGLHGHHNLLQLRLRGAAQCRGRGRICCAPGHTAFPCVLLLVLFCLLFQVRFLRRMRGPAIDTVHQAVPVGLIAERLGLCGVQPEAAVVDAMLDEVHADELCSAAAAEAQDEVDGDDRDVGRDGCEGDQREQPDDLDTEQLPCFLAAAEEEAPKLALAVRPRKQRHRDHAPGARDAVHGDCADDVVQLKFAHDRLEGQREASADKSDHHAHGRRHAVARSTTRDEASQDSVGQVRNGEDQGPKSYGRHDDARDGSGRCR